VITSQTVFDTKFALVVPAGDALIDVASDFANDAAAATGGIKVGGLYHTSGAVKIRLT